MARPADAAVSGTWDTLPTDTDSRFPADAMTEILLATASVAAGVVGARALRRRQRPGTLEQSPRPATTERSGIPAGGQW